jgi:hypothetical protein
VSLLSQQEKKEDTLQRMLRLYDTINNQCTSL